MAFKRAQKPMFTAVVTVNIPNDKCGFDINTLVAHYKRLNTAEVKALRSEGLSNEDLVRRVMVGWDLQDEDTKETVPFTSAELEAAMQIMPTPYALAQAFWECQAGTRTKN